MTAGYGAGDGAPGQGAEEAADPGRREPPVNDRPGPLPPRFARPAGHAPVPGPTGFPAPPGGGFPAPAAGSVPASPPDGFPAPAAGHPTPGARCSTPAAGFGVPPAVPGAGIAGSDSAGAPPRHDPGSASPITAPGAPGQSAVPTPRATWSNAPDSGRWGGPSGASAAPGGWPSATATGQPAGLASAPGQPAGAAPPVGQPTSAAPAFGQPAPGVAYPGQPAGGPALPGQPASGPAYPGGAVDPAARPRRLPVVALVLAGVLAVVAGIQAYQIHRLDDRLAATNRRLTEVQGVAGTRFDGLEQRAGELEKQAGAAFNPEAVASAVLPSVFRVRAGNFTGTAFAIGKPPAGGGATLLTNFHVVESVYDGGGRKVFLERTDQRFEATIVRVDKDKDIAQLRTTARFKALVAAATPVKSGQQIVVVGAPLGLQDTVTTGVVSAFREDEDGSGPVIQFDAPINPGNSGGPVINGAKEVVGIATAKARDAEGIGLAVPIKTACDTFSLC
ncbi:trypsin-like peptidase domain-containing protein [Micromonospora sp. MS34]|uniref:trypsin-like peptidase domain-containing protein n=1 Tax=Micromonospora sp. MS34 TaxID=3385971 RepID=UPI0039A2EC50